MTYNHSFEEKKFKEEWAEKAKEYRKAGMTEEQIAEIYDFDREVFNSNRRYLENTTAIQDDESLKTEDNYLANSRYGWLDEIGDMEAYKKVMALPEIWREAFTMYIYDGYTQEEISSVLLRNQSNISRAIDKIAEILRN